MGQGMHFFQLLDAHLGIDLGGVHSGMAQHRLDKADIRPVLQHVGGHGMAEQVAGAFLADIRGVDVIAHQGG